LGALSVIRIFRQPCYLARHVEAPEAQPYCTFKMNAAVCVNVPECPVDLIPTAPAGVLGDVLMDRVAVAECVPSRSTELGEIPQLRAFPLGTAQVRATAPLKFAVGDMVNVALVDAPGDRLAFVGETEIVKFGGMILKITPYP